MQVCNQECLNSFQLNGSGGDCDETTCHFAILSPVVVAQCPPGEVVLGGSYDLNFGGGTSTYNGPNASGTAWTESVTGTICTSFDTQPCLTMNTIQAICAPGALATPSN